MAAGTLFGIPLSQPVDLNGRPMPGAKLFIYLANTTTIRNAYKDTALSPAQIHSHPMVADANGRIPAFWVDTADSYRALLTNAAGVTQFDEQSIMPIGQSGAAGPGPGGTGDPTPIEGISTTGDVKWRPTHSTLTGWVRMNGNTIGKTTATEPGGTDADGVGPLYLFLYGAFPDSVCPVSGGRTGNASNDYNSNKQLTLLDMRGRAPFGLDDMGNAAAGKLTGAVFDAGGPPYGPTIGAAKGGAAQHTLTTAQMPSHQHDAFIRDPQHSHGFSNGTTALTQFNGGVATPGGGTTYGGATINSVATGVHVNSVSGGLAGTDDKVAAVGGGGAHPTVSPFMLGTWFMRK